MPATVLVAAVIATLLGLLPSSASRPMSPWPTRSVPFFEDVKDEVERRLRSRDHPTRFPVRAVNASHGSKRPTASARGRSSSTAVLRCPSQNNGGTGPLRCRMNHYNTPLAIPEAQGDPGIDAGAHGRQPVRMPQRRVSGVCGLPHSVHKTRVQIRETQMFISAG